MQGEYNQITYSSYIGINSLIQKLPSSEISISPRELLLRHQYWMRSFNPFPPLAIINKRSEAKKKRCSLSGAHWLGYKIEKKISFSCFFIFFCTSNTQPTYLNQLLSEKCIHTQRSAAEKEEMAESEEERWKFFTLFFHYFDASCCSSTILSACVMTSCDSTFRFKLHMRNIPKYRKKSIANW